MIQTFGDYVEEEGGQEYLIIRFSPTSVPLQQRWRNNGLSADFLAEYCVTFFPAHDIEAAQRQSEIKGAINYIANELLENVMKFSYKPTHHSVGLGLYLYEDEFKFYATNVVDPQTVEGFRAHIQMLLAEDPQTLYLRQLERNVMDGSDTGSGLGLLTMVNDYGAHLAWKFEPLSQEPEVVIVTTMVQLAL